MLLHHKILKIKCRLSKTCQRSPNTQISMGQRAPMMKTFWRIPWEGFDDLISMICKIKCFQISTVIVPLRQLHSYKMCSYYSQEFISYKDLVSRRHNQLFLDGQSVSRQLLSVNNDLDQLCWINGHWLVTWFVVDFPAPLWPIRTDNFTILN